MLLGIGNITVAQHLANRETASQQQIVFYTERGDMDGGMRQVNFEQEIREFNQQALTLAKLVVTSGDRLAIEALGLSNQDVELLASVTTSDLRAIASVDKSLFGLRYGPGAIKNVLRTAGRGDQSLTHSVLACSTPRVPDQSALV